MSYLLEVCLVAVTFAGSLTPSLATRRQTASADGSWFAGAPHRQTEQSANSAPALQKGISVLQASARNAVPVPEADREEAIIVTVTHDGRVYMGVDPVADAALAAQINASLSTQTGKNLYIKADARTPYAKVAKVLDAARATHVKSVILLTSQPRLRQPGGLLPPVGLDVQLGGPSRYGPDVTAVNMFHSAQQSPRVEVDHRPVAWPSLQGTLMHNLQNTGRKVVLIEAEGRLAFSQVVQVIDLCRSMKAQVVLVNHPLRTSQPLTVPNG